MRFGKKKELLKVNNSIVRILEGWQGWIGTGRKKGDGGMDAEEFISAIKDNIIGIM